MSNALRVDYENGEYYLNDYDMVQNWDEIVAEAELIDELLDPVYTDGYSKLVRVTFETGQDYYLVE